MTHRFSETPSVDIPRSTFNRSHGVKTTFDAGYLVPIFLDEALPGDTFKVKTTGFARLSTPTYPIMDNMFMDTFFFAVPMRLVWDNWQKFCGEQVDPGDSIAYTIPITASKATGYDNESIFDYFGLPTKVTTSFDHSCLPLRAYYKIWNEWFRDENLQDSLDVSTGNGPDLYTAFELQKRGKRHDYFTSALPWLQKGDAVQLSLGSEAEVWTDGANTEMIGVYSSTATDHVSMETDGTAGGNLVLDTGSAGTIHETNKLYANLATATASTVNELRQAIQVQRLLERDARSGTRYTEIIKSHFGVSSADQRLQRPEYLGGGSSPVQVTPVARTDSSPGVLGAMGTCAFGGHGFVKSFTEHCIIIGLVNVRADLTYQEGLDKMWDRSTRYDFYWPTLAHLGEQAILNKEIYCDGSANDELVFGYQERYAEYRYKQSKITGKFRSNDTATLDAWHLGIEFGSLPTFDDTFIVEAPPIDRVIATPTEPHFIYDSYINMTCTRPMPMYSVPGLIDHF